MGIPLSSRTPRPGSRIWVAEQPVPTCVPKAEDVPEFFVFFFLKLFVHFKSLTSFTWDLSTTELA